MEPNWTIRSYYVKMGSNGSIGVQSGPNGSIWVQTGPNMSKLIQIGSNRSNKFKYDMISSKMIHSLTKKSSKWVQHNQVSSSGFKRPSLHYSLIIEELFFPFKMGPDFGIYL